MHNGKSTYWYLPSGYLYSCPFCLQIKSVDEFVNNVNSSLRQKQDNERLRGIIARIESYDAVVSSTDLLYFVPQNQKFLITGNEGRWPTTVSTETHSVGSLPTDARLPSREEKTSSTWGRPQTQGRNIIKGNKYPFWPSPTSFHFWYFRLPNSDILLSGFWFT